MDYVQWMTWDSGSQSVVSKTETSALLGKLLEMQSWSPISDLLNQQWWGGGWGVGSSLCLASTFYDSHAL